MYIIIIIRGNKKEELSYWPYMYLKHCNVYYFKQLEGLGLGGVYSRAVFNTCHQNYLELVIDRNSRPNS